jgi:hypothetical protein
MREQKTWAEENVLLVAQSACNKLAVMEAHEGALGTHKHIYPKKLPNLTRSRLRGTGQQVKITTAIRGILEDVLCSPHVGFTSVFFLFFIVRLEKHIY